jgi:hypothetical protein
MVPYDVCADVCVALIIIGDKSSGADLRKAGGPGLHANAVPFSVRPLTVQGLSIHGHPGASPVLCWIQG